MLNTTSTIIGTDAGNASNQSNTLIGYRSGKDNVTGTANTFFGYQSWELNTTSDSNTFVGWSRSRQRYAQCVCRLIRDPVGDLIDSTMHVHIIGE